MDNVNEDVLSKVVQLGEMGTLTAPADTATGAEPPETTPHLVAFCRRVFGRKAFKVTNTWCHFYFCQFFKMYPNDPHPKPAEVRL